MVYYRVCHVIFWWAHVSSIVSSCLGKPWDQYVDILQWHGVVSQLWGELLTMVNTILDWRASLFQVIQMSSKINRRVPSQPMWHGFSDRHIAIDCCGRIRAEVIQVIKVVFLLSVIFNFDHWPLTMLLDVPVYWYKSIEIPFLRVVPPVFGEKFRWDDLTIDTHTHRPLCSLPLW